VDTAPKDAVAERLIAKHFEVEPEVERILYFDDEGTITLVEVSGSTPASGSIEAFVFGPTKDVPFMTRIAEITPEEYDRFRDAPPSGWDFSRARVFERPSQQ
jgi:hypothetical protein